MIFDFFETDWDSDGDVEIMDDIITLELLEEINRDEKKNKENGLNGVN